jgi:phage shock protein PspC (stress-responsive transcriptional regulator)
MDTTTTNRLERPVGGRVVAGVAEGIGRHAGVDPAVVRIGFAATSLFGGLGVLLYVIAWLAVPEEGADRPLFGRTGTTWLVWVLASLAVLAVVDLVAYGAWVVWPLRP